MFKAGISDPVNTVLAWYVARDAGFYAANGLNVDIINMSGGSRGAAELQAGRLDTMHVGLSSVIKVNRAGGDLRAIGSLSNVIRFTFFSAPGVRTAADLKGGVIGVSTFGSESDSTVTLALQRLGLTRDDVTLKEYGGGTRRLEAVKSGEIKATPINEPIASMARAQGVHVLVDLVPEQIPWVFSSIVVRRADIEGRRDALLRFLKATIEGNYLALADAGRASRSPTTISRHSRPPTSTSPSKVPGTFSRSSAAIRTWRTTPTQACSTRCAAKGFSPRRLRSTSCSKAAARRFCWRRTAILAGIRNRCQYPCRPEATTAGLTFAWGLSHEDLSL